MLELEFHLELRVIVDGFFACRQDNFVLLLDLAIVINVMRKKIRGIGDMFGERLKYFLVFKAKSLISVEINPLHITIITNKNIQKHISTLIDVWPCD